MRLAFASNKGGVGKTTLAINVASFQSQSRRMTLYDADPQRSSLHWSSIRESNSNLAVESFSEQDRYAKHAVFDCPPAIHHPDTLAVLRVADVVLIPVLPSPLGFMGNACCCRRDSTGATGQQETSGIFGIESNGISLSSISRNKRGVGIARNLSVRDNNSTPSGLSQCDSGWARCQPVRKRSDRCFTGNH